jgi:hypothetical protein
MARVNPDSRNRTPDTDTQVVEAKTQEAISSIGVWQASDSLSGNRIAKASPSYLLPEFIFFAVARLLPVV